MTEIVKQDINIQLCNLMILIVMWFRILSENDAININACHILHIHIMWPNLRHQTMNLLDTVWHYISIVKTAWTKLRSAVLQMKIKTLVTYNIFIGNELANTPILHNWYGNITSGVHIDFITKPGRYIQDKAGIYVTHIRIYVYVSIRQRSRIALYRGT